MNKRLLFIAFLCILMAFLVAGCDETPAGGPVTDAAPPTVTATTETVDVRDKNVASYDFTTLFSITENGQHVSVKPEYLNLSGISGTAGTYQVTCTYSGVSATATVNVYASVYTVSLAERTVTIKRSEAANYDYKALFTITDDAGTAVPVTDEMVSTDLVSEVGSYTYRVTYGGESKTLAITVIPDHTVEIMTSYRNPALAPDEVVGYDMTSLFSLYVDGVPVKVTADMLDVSAVPTDAAQVHVGDTYAVTLSYTTADGLASHAKETIITVREREVTVLTGYEKNIYINARPIDVTTLFRITRGDTVIPVTFDMVSGEINYAKSGDYTLTLTYEGDSQTAVVHVLDGVVLGYAASDTVQVRAGTDPLVYPFSEDFTVVINGVPFYHIPQEYFDLSQVDFTTAGTYQATLTVPYNEKSQTSSFEKPTPVMYSLPITYVVMNNDYRITVLEETLVLPKGTTSYNVFNNIYVTINGKWQTLTENADWVNFITCYAEVLSSPVDFTSIAEQEVVVDVYVNGAANAPVEVRYTLRVESGITISAGSTAIFSGNTLYVKDLFTIREGHREIPVTSDMISGKVDVFTPGSYEVSIDYMGMTATATVVVLDHLLLGDYFTPLTTIPYYVASDNDEEEDVYVSGRGIAGLKITEDGAITFANVKDGRIMAGSDANTLRVKQGINEYTLYYHDGIIVLDPENALGTPFNDYKRPYVYFRSDMYTVTESVTVGYSDKYVLMADGTYAGMYSIDTFHVTPKAGGEDFWFALYVKLIEKMSSDTFYTVKWGNASYPDDFEPRRGATSTLTFDGEMYPFTMWDGSNGKVERPSAANPWKSCIFTGTIDGKRAEIRCDQYGHLTLYIDSRKVAYVNTSVSYGAYADIDAKAETIAMHAVDDREGYGTYSYFFDLDTTAMTFTARERDSYFGDYVLGDFRLFFDGFGTGHAFFDPASSASTRFRYTVEDSLVRITYMDIKPKFAYGTGAEFYISPLLNVLTVRAFDGADIVGEDFVNAKITDGAIVHIGTTFMTTYASNALGRTALLPYITITTKDGVMSINELDGHVNTKAVNFAKAGFYLFTINLTVGGEEVTTRHAIQILPKIYEGHTLANAWSFGLLGSTELSVNEWGLVTLKLGAEVYTGLATLTEDTLFANVYNSERSRITLTGRFSEEGLLSVTGAGITSFKDIYTLGTVRAIGFGKYTLREITYHGTPHYYLTDSATALGEEVTVTALGGAELHNSGTIMEIVGKTTLYVQVASWGNAATGGIQADIYRGSYTLAGGETLVVDGFGNVTLGALAGTYRITNTGVITVTYNAADVKLYRLNAADMTYTVVVTPTGEALVAGATYSGSYSFVCGYAPYTADTRFEFRAGGVVVVYSSSYEHDDGEDACFDDSYSPTFASVEGVEGSYTVTGDRVTVSVAGETFVFLISNLQGAGELVCESTTVASDAHGRFGVGTAFGRDA